MARPRPYSIQYPGGAVGHCVSVRHAILRATIWLLADSVYNRSLNKCNILYEGSYVANVTRQGYAVHINWIRGRLAHWG